MLYQGPTPGPRRGAWPRNLGMYTLMKEANFEEWGVMGGPTVEAARQ
jgi:hypothetical protein